MTNPNSASTNNSGNNTALTKKVLLKKGMNLRNVATHMLQKN